tara:strand:+ start:1565 stop:2212 length:648 start_codon:yes stop_codon:yes gene_type:complete
MIIEGISVIFDFDGTLVKTNFYKKNLYTELFSNNNNISEKEINSIVKKYYGSVNRKTIISKILKSSLDAGDFSEKNIEHYFSLYSQKYIQYSSSCNEISGTTEILRLLSSNINIFINTANPESDIRTIISRRKWDCYFKGIFGSPRNKAEIINHIVKLENLNRSSFFMVGDNQEDFDSALATRINFIGIINSESDFDKTPDKVINSVSSLLEVIK